jgi:hypothetical protein
VSIIKAYFLLFTLVVFCSCSKQRDLVGTWKVKGYTLWEKGTGYLRGVRGLTSGTELTLKADSSYRETTCGNIIVGKWTKEGDSLVLKSDTTWYYAVKWYREHRDSNYDSIAGICSHNRTAYGIKPDKLITIFKGKSYIMQPDGSEKEAKGYYMEILK